MKEIFSEVKTYQINCSCPNCKRGILLSTEKIRFDNDVEKYEHACSDCSWKTWLKKIYPYQEKQILN